MSEAAQAPVDALTTGDVVTPGADVATSAPAPVPTEMDSAKWAALAKREQKLVHRDLAIKKREEELAAKEKELTSKLTPFQEFEVMKSKDPVAALRSLGFSETDIFNWLSDSAPKELTTEQKAEIAAQKKIDEFKKEQADAASKAEKERETEILTRFKGRLESFLGANKEKYEACADYGSIATEAAYNLIKQIAKDTGEVITPDEAYSALETFYDGEYERMSKYNKFQKKVEEPVIVAKEKEKIDKEVPRGTKTLTNAASPTLASTVKRQETREEKRERLISQIKQTGLTK